MLRQRFVGKLKNVPITICKKGLLSFIVYLKDNASLKSIRLRYPKIQLLRMLLPTQFLLKCHLESLVARYSIPKSGKSSFQNDAPLGKNLDRKLVSSLLMSEKYYEMYPLHTCSSIAWWRNTVCRSTTVVVTEAVI